MIDIHVLTHSGTRSDWLAQCLGSLKAEPCTVHVVKGDEGRIGPGRARGFMCGGHPYVGFVDSDDFVLPGVMGVVTRAMKNSVAVVTDEHIMEGGKIVGMNQRHHLFVGRRDRVTPLLRAVAESDSWCERVLHEWLVPQRVPFIGYVWRKDGMQSRLVEFAEKNKKAIPHEIP